MSTFASSRSARLAAGLPVAMVSLTMVAFILVKTARDAAYFDHARSLETLPLSFMWIGVAAVPAAALHLRLMSALGTRRARITLYALAGVSLLALAPMVRVEHGAFMQTFFVVVPVLFAAIFASAWLLAGDLLEHAEPELKAKAYARIGAGSTLGGVVGGLSARALAPYVPTSGLVALGAVILIGVIGVAYYAHARFPVPRGDGSGPRGEPQPTPIRRLPLVRALVGVSALAAVAGLLIEFQFYSVSTTSGHASAEFFASFYVYVSAASFVLQLMLAPLVQRRFGVGGALMVLPFVLTSAASVITVAATVASQALLKVTESGLKVAIHRSAWEQAYLPLPREARGRAKAMVDGAGARVAEGLVALGLYALMAITGRPPDERLVSWVIVGVLVLWVASTRRLQRIGVEPTRGAEPGIVVAAPLPESCPVASAMGAEQAR